VEPAAQDGRSRVGRPRYEKGRSRERTHPDYAIYCQEDSSKRPKAKPRQLSSWLSISYRSFGADFEEFCTVAGAVDQGFWVQKIERAGKRRRTVLGQSRNVTWNQRIPQLRTPIADGLSLRNVGAEMLASERAPASGFHRPGTRCPSWKPRFEIGR